MVSPINPPGFRPNTDSPFNAPTAKETSVGQRGQGPAGLSQNRDGAVIRTAEDAINVLRARIEQRLSERLQSSDSGRSAAAALEPRGFAPPSAEQVASRVLGFVQQRLQAEADSGADTERLAGLLSDARAGVEQGFAEAREQIEALGMMQGGLNADIDDSFNRIQSGLDDLEVRFLAGEPPAATQATSFAADYRVEQASESLFSFEVTTREGDRVTVEMAERQYAGASLSVASSGDRSGAELNAISAFSGRYSFSVEGDLNSEEQKALAQLFQQVEKVSSRFFDGNIQAAFNKAQSLNLRGDELASFSLSLTSTRIQSASAYEAVSQQPSANSELRPLGGLARELQSVAESAFTTGIDRPAFEGLMQTLLDGLREPAQTAAPDTSVGSPTDRTTSNLMTDFMRAVIESLDTQPGLPGQADA